MTWYLGQEEGGILEMELSRLTVNGFVTFKLYFLVCGKSLQLREKLQPGALAFLGLMHAVGGKADALKLQN